MFTPDTALIRLPYMGKTSIDAMPIETIDMQVYVGLRCGKYRFFLFVPY